MSQRTDDNLKQAIPMFLRMLFNTWLLPISLPAKNTRKEDLCCTGGGTRTNDFVQRRVTAETQCCHDCKRSSTTVWILKPRDHVTVQDGVPAAPVTSFMQ